MSFIRISRDVAFPVPLGPVSTPSEKLSGRAPLVISVPYAELPSRLRCAHWASACKQRRASSIANAPEEYRNEEA